MAELLQQQAQNHLNSHGSTAKPTAILADEPKKLPSGALFIHHDKLDDRARAVKLYNQQMVNLHKLSQPSRQNDISVSKRAEMIIKIQELDASRMQRFTIGFLQTGAYHHLYKQLSFDDAHLFSDAMLFEITENDYKNLHNIISPYLMTKEMKDLEYLANELAIINPNDDNASIEKIAKIGCEVAAIIEGIFHRLPNKTLLAIQQWEDEIDKQSFSVEPQSVEVILKKYIPNDKLAEFNQLNAQYGTAIQEKNTIMHEEISQKLWGIIKKATENLPIQEQLHIENMFNTKPAIHQKIGTSGGWGLIRHLMSTSMKDPFVE